MPSRHRIGLDTFHYKWNRSHRPVLTINDGDAVSFEINDVGTWQLTQESDSEDINHLDTGKFYPLAGPVLVEGARPGDALVVETVDVKVADFGWSAIIPGLGLLEEFEKPYLYKWDLRNKETVAFERGIKIPVRPFCGVLGVAPPEEGQFEVMPPGRHGGNLDIRHLTAGSRIRVPVWVDGALFSVGDVHAAWAMERCASARSSARERPP
jgi:acetamidase/formamidase